MRILVVDDNPLHLDAAEAQLSDHDLIVERTYDRGEVRLAGAHNFDIVMVDLLMPGKLDIISRRHLFDGLELSIGIFLALLAAKNGSSKAVVFTDQNHHDHPASTCFDAFQNHECEPQPLQIESSQLFLCNNRNWVELFKPDDLKQSLEWSEWDKFHRETAVRAKNWRKLLDYILSDAYLQGS